MNLVPTKDSPKTRRSDKVLKISPNLQRLQLYARLHLNHWRNLEIKYTKLIVFQFLRFQKLDRFIYSQICPCMEEKKRRLMCFSLQGYTKDFIREKLMGLD